MFSVTCFLSLSLLFVFSFETLHPFSTFSRLRRRGVDGPEMWRPNPDRWGGRAPGKAEGLRKYLWDDIFCERITVVYTVHMMIICWQVVEAWSKLSTVFFLFPKGLHQAGISKISRLWLKLLPCRCMRSLASVQMQKIVWFGYPSRHVRHRILMAFQPRNVLKALSLEEKKDLRRLGKEISH